MACLNVPFFIANGQCLMDVLFLNLRCEKETAGLFVSQHEFKDSMTLISKDMGAHLLLTKTQQQKWQM